MAAEAAQEASWDLLIATNNRGKLAELSELLSDTPFRLLSLSDVGIDFEGP